MLTQGPASAQNSNCMAAVGLQETPTSSTQEHRRQMTPNQKEKTNHSPFMCISQVALLSSVFIVMKKDLEKSTFVMMLIIS